MTDHIDEILQLNKEDLYALLEDDNDIDVDVSLEELSSIDLEEEGDFKVLCQVIRIEKPIHDEDIYWVGMKYTDLNERMRGKLIKFIFKKQREIIKNRK